VDDPRQGGEALGRAVSGLAVLAARYDLFLIDQYGVLHDGAAAYPGVVACLERLRAGGGKVVVLSNSGLRAADNEARLSAVGIARDLYDICLSSGEVAWRALAEGRLPAFVGARRCVLLTRGERPGFLDGLDLEMTEDAARADFVLLSGSDAPARGLADYARLLAPALARGVPVASHVMTYAARLLTATHPSNPDSPEVVRRFVRYGASPRGMQALILAGKIMALMDGRYNLAYDDIRVAALPALRHRLILNFEAQAEGVSTDTVISELLGMVNPEVG